jgi:general secretion pathway protein G
MSRRRRRGQGGFTLIELLVVIAVLAVLAGIVIFNVTGVANRGKSSACATDKQSLQTAVDAYNNDKGSYPSDGAGLVSQTDLVPTYLHTWPTEQPAVTWTIDNTTGTVTTNCS